MCQTHRIIKSWNTVLEEVVSNSSTDTCRTRLDTLKKTIISGRPSAINTQISICSKQQTNDTNNTLKATTTMCIPQQLASCTYIYFRMVNVLIITCEQYQKLFGFTAEKQTCPHSETSLIVYLYVKNIRGDGFHIDSRYCSFNQLGQYIHTERVPMVTFMKINENSDTNSFRAK